MVENYLRNLRPESVEKLLGHFKERRRVHEDLRELFDESKVDEGKRDKYLRLALGIDDRMGNYSASEPWMGEWGRKIYESENHEEVFECAVAFADCRNVKDLWDTIERQRIDGMKIGVGSEIAMMLRPEKFWVGNKRTLWAHFLVQKKDARKAKEAFDVARETELGPWYAGIGESLRELGEVASEILPTEGVSLERYTYLWADVVADRLFEVFVRDGT